MNPRHSKSGPREALLCHLKGMSKGAGCPLSIEAGFIMVSLGSTLCTFTFLTIFFSLRAMATKQEANKKGTNIGSLEKISWSLGEESLNNPLKDEGKKGNKTKGFISKDETTIYNSARWFGLN